MEVGVNKAFEYTGSCGRRERQRMADPWRERIRLLERSDQANFAGRAAIIVMMGATGITFLVIIGAEVLIRRDVGRRQRP